MSHDYGHNHNHAALNVDESTNKTPILAKAQSKVKIVKKNPLLVTEIELNEDFYALTWNACRKARWNKKVAGVKITMTESDERWLIVQFLLFISIVLVTVSILLYESFATDAYKDATWPIIILRLTLVAFAQQKLEPEMYQGLALLRYTIRKEEEFSHPIFAKFVAFCQFMIALITFTSIFLFVCMANEALELIMNFAGLAVISELDDWVGEQIMSEKLHLEYDSDVKLDTTNLNDRMHLTTKMCLIGEELEIQDDLNISTFDNCFFRWFSFLLGWVPFRLTPFLTLPTESLLLYIQSAGDLAGIETRRGGKEKHHRK